MYFFLSLLSLLDLSYATTTVPQMLIHLVSKSKTISYCAGCVIQDVRFPNLSITETWIFAAMAYDRYVAMLPTPLWGQMRPNPVCTLAVSSALVVSPVPSLYTVFAMNLPYCGPNEINHSFVKFLLSWSWLVQIHPSMVQVGLYLGLYLLLIPLSFILASYVRIFTAILKIRSTQGQIKAFSTCASHITVVTMFCIPCMVMYMRPGSKASPRGWQQAGSVLQCHFCLPQPPSSTASGTRMKRASSS